MRLRCLMLGMALAGFSGVQAHAGEPTPARVVRTAPAAYPAAAKAAGAQGRVRVEATLLASGALADAKVVESSRSPELDAAALEAFKQWTMSPALDANGQPQATRVRQTFGFYKDTLNTGMGAISRKSCADFVTDMNWFAAKFPELSVSEMRLYKITLGAFSLAFGGAGSQFDQVQKIFPTAYDATYEACTEQPKAGFLAILRLKVVTR